MEEIVKFLLDRKEGIKLAFVEEQCGMGKGTLRPGAVPIPIKYKGKLIEVLTKYYSYKEQIVDSNVTVASGEYEIAINAKGEEYVSKNGARVVLGVGTKVYTK